MQVMGNVNACFIISLTFARNFESLSPEERFCLLRDFEDIGVLKGDKFALFSLSNMSFQY